MNDVSNKSTVKHRIAFEYYHLHGAQYFCTRLASIERSAKATPATISKHQAYASSCILASVAFLEASINSFINAAASDNRISTDAISFTAGNAITNMWPHIERKPVLEKFQIVMKLAGYKPFNKGDRHHQNAALLVRLRNALIHYKPEWSDKLEEHLQIEKQLRNRFALNPFSEEWDLFFPKKCLGHGCAKWAASSAIDFINEFYTRIGVSEFLIRGKK